MDYLWSLILSAIGTIFGSAGLWAYLKSKIETRKTPYDMLVQMIGGQKKFYEEKNADLSESVRIAPRSLMSLRRLQSANTGSAMLPFVVRLRRQMMNA